MRMIYAVKIYETGTDELKVMLVKIGYTSNVETLLNQYKRTSPNAKLLDLWEINNSTEYRNCEKGAHLIAEKYALKRERETFIFIQNKYDEFSQTIGCLLKKNFAYSNIKEKKVKGSKNAYMNKAGKKPIKFKFQNEEYQIKSWRDLLVNVLHILYEKKPEIFKENILKFKFISTNKNSLRRPEQIEGTRYYVETNFSANSVYKNIISILQKFDYSEKDLEIYYRE